MRVVIKALDGGISCTGKRPPYSKLDVLGLNFVSSVAKLD